MVNTQREKIERYFNAWIENNIEGLDNIFDINALYIESWGPEYDGLNKIKRWFAEWNKTGKVVDWTIKQYISEGNRTCVEWHFRAEYNNKKQPDDFDGVSLVEFNADNKIISLKEFASKFPHYLPYK